MTLEQTTLNQSVVSVFRPMYCLGVEAEEDCDAVAGAAGDLGRGDTGLQPEGDAGSAKSVRDFSEGRLCFLFGEDGQASGLPDVAVLLAEQAAVPDSAEEPSVVGRAELVDVVPDQADEDRGNGHLAGGPPGALLEAAGVVGLTRVCPAGADACRAGRQDDLPQHHAPALGTPLRGRGPGRDPQTGPLPARARTVRGIRRLRDPGHE